MSGEKIDKVILQNFKCHKTFEMELKNLNILTGSNAAGKSSIIQAILLAFKGWKDYEKKQVVTNQVYGLNLGIPINIVFENLEQTDVIIKLFFNDIENQLVLRLPEDEEEMYFEICNCEEIAERCADVCSLKKMNLFFLNAERQGPRIISFIQETAPYSVGCMGENTAYVISELDKLQKLNSRFQLPKDLKISTLDRFSANCEEWLNTIIPDTGLQYNVDMERNLATLRIRNQGEFYLPVATGFGITYVLPIVVQALVASVVKNSVLIVENPEAHLHPLSQSRLGKFLALVAANGVQVILETHSEHIIDGCRIQSAKEKQCRNTKILFFEKKDNCSVCKDIAIRDDGELEEWPIGFFDQKRMDLRELLEMRRCGN